jgi:hypothetical protein
MDTFPPSRNYSLLTLKDLLDARDHYHVHLTHLRNVVGTAVGRYLIREEDWYAKHRPNDKDHKHHPKPAGARTLFNSVVRDWSWPCVLVFVNEWQPRTAFGKDPDLMVPRALFLPDGRVVPTCTVLTQNQSPDTSGQQHLSFSNSFIGGGYVTFADVQGRVHVGSIGCLVTDGDLTYALTNRHVVGSPGRELFTVFSGKRVPIGISDEKQLTSRPFGKMYRGWAGENVQLHLDAGLIRIHDIADWTTQVAGMGPLADWLDLTTDNLTLDLIDTRVRAFGAASGELFGKIAALFYRYSAAGGTDYVTDFLIRPQSLDQQGTLRGDSGTLWFWEEQPSSNNKGRHRKHTSAQEPVLRPFAMQWGGHTWIEDGQCKRTGRFALATSLSTICRELDVTLLRDWNTGLPEYWGPVGHYTIGFFACDKLPANLGKLMKLNQEIVSYPLDSIRSKTKINERGPGGFVPLADVPDRLWAHGKMIRGGADKPNHFADMDQKDPQHGGKTLLQLCIDPSNVTPDFWLEYYRNVGDSGRGLLPFRVWQFFDEMADAASHKDINRYVAAAGICAHYVGDACQPLHCSYLHDGEPQGKGKPPRGKGVHSAYEEAMLRQNAPELLTRLQTQLNKNNGTPSIPKDGHAAAVTIVDLMRRTFTTIPPMEIVDAYASNADADLWAQFGDRTIRVLADGVQTLRAVWMGAWNAGNGKAVQATRIKEADPKTLIRLYMRKTWAPSKTLRTVSSVLNGLSSAHSTSGAVPEKHTGKKSKARK